MLSTASICGQFRISVATPVLDVRDLYQINESWEKWSEAKPIKSGVPVELNIGLLAWLKKDKGLGLNISANFIQKNTVMEGYRTRYENGVPVSYDTKGLRNVWSPGVKIGVLKQIWKSGPKRAYIEGGGWLNGGGPQMLGPYLQGSYLWNWSFLEMGANLDLRYGLFSPGSVVILPGAEIRILLFD